MALPALKIQDSHRYQRAILTLVSSQREYDPTRTLSLRNAFARDMSKRFRKLRGLIRKAIDKEDCFALKELANIQTNMMFWMETPGRHAFDFPRSGDKVTAFMDWLKTQEQAKLLEIMELPQIGTAIEPAWTNIYVRGAYQKGIERARKELNIAGFDVPSIQESGGLGVVFNQPFHLDRVGLLYTRTFSELKGIAGAMDQQISRVLAQGMADGLNPRTIARQLTKTISGPDGDLGLTDTLGRFIPAERRARILARTEIIRAHHNATIQEYRNWAVEGVIVRAELRTAGDNRVCSECAGLDGQDFSLDEAEGLIPVHPQCRCIVIPKVMN